MLPQPFRTIEKRSGANTGPVGIFPRLFLILWLGLGAYTATCLIPFRECMQIHAERARLQRFDH